MITIQQEKCIGCGQCTKVCPFTVLKMNENKKAYCQDKACIECMHCAAICPVNAITYEHEVVVEEETKCFPEDGSDTLELLIKQRRSYRRFQDKKVPREEISRILGIADLVPSAKNQHPTKWIVLDDTEKREKMMQQIFTFCKEKNVLPELISEYENGNNPVLGENASVLVGYCESTAINGVTDTAIALTTIELMMQAKQIGTCWAGYLTYFLNLLPECRRIMQLPEGTTVCGTLIFGYPAQKEYRYIPKRLHKAEIQFVD